MRISGIRSAYSAMESTFEVSVYPTDLRHFVVITEVADNPGPSITNCAEFAAPQLASILRIPWKQALFIESYPADEWLGQHDPTFDRIAFKHELTTMPGFASRPSVPKALFAEPGSRPLDLHLATALQEAGCQMSTLIGQAVRLRDRAQDERGHCHVLGYDGRRYYTNKGVFASEDLVGLPTERTSRGAAHKAGPSP